jgi:hypothetical protein
VFVAGLYAGLYALNRYSTALAKDVVPLVRKMRYPHEEGLSGKVCSLIEGS